MSGLLSAAMVGLGDGMAQSGQFLMRVRADEEKEKRLRSYEEKVHKARETREDGLLKQAWEREDTKEAEKWEREDAHREEDQGFLLERLEKEYDLKASTREPPKPATFTADDGRLMMLGRDGTAKPVTEDTTRPFEDYPRFDENDRVPGLLSGQRDQPVRAAPKASDAIKPTALVQNAEYLVRHAGFATPREAVEFLNQSKYNPQESIVKLTADMVQKQSESFVQPGDEGYRTPEQFAEDAKAIVRAAMRDDAPAPGGQAASGPPGYPEGTRLRGPDGKIYVVRDGKPVLAE